MRHIALTSLAIAALLGAFPAAAPAYTPGAQSTYMDTSIRASGMGRTGVSVFWGEDPNDWANPALLGYREGIRYERGKTQLVPDLADDIFLESDRISVAAYGIGMMFSGMPVTGVGGTRLSLGTIEAIDFDGNQLGTVETWERVRSFGLGVNVLQVLEHASDIVGIESPMFSRYADVSLGHSWKEIESKLGDASTTLDGSPGYGKSRERDRGLLVRVTPYNAIDYPGTLPGLESVFRARIDASIGWSEINYTDATLTVMDPDQAEPITQVDRSGFGVHASITLPHAKEIKLREQNEGWIVDLFTPLLEFGAAWDEVEFPEGYYSSDPPIESNGWEVTLGNVFTYRRGHIRDVRGTIVGGTSGYSVGLRFGQIFGARYDHATVPQSTYLDDVDREGFTVVVEPVAFWNWLN